MNVTKQVRTPRMQFFRLQGHICSHIIDYIYTGCVPKYVHSRQEGTYMPGADFSFSAHTIDMAHCSSFADRLWAWVGYYRAVLKRPAPLRRRERCGY